MKQVLTRITYAGSASGARWQQGGRVLVGQAVRFGHRAVTHTDPEPVSLTVDIAAAGRPPCGRRLMYPPEVVNPEH